MAQNRQLQAMLAALGMEVPGGHDATLTDTATDTGTGCTVMHHNVTTVPGTTVTVPPRKAVTRSEDRKLAGPNQTVGEADATLAYPATVISRTETRRYVSGRGDVTTVLPCPGDPSLQRQRRSLAPLSNKPRVLPVLLLPGLRLLRIPGLLPARPPGKYVNFGSRNPPLDPGPMARCMTTVLPAEASARRAVASNHGTACRAFAFFSLPNRSTGEAAMADAEAPHATSLIRLLICIQAYIERGFRVQRSPLSCLLANKLLPSFSFTLVVATPSSLRSPRHCVLLLE